MADDTDPLLDATTALVPPLLTGLNALGHAARRLHPPDLDVLIAHMAPFGPPLDEGLRQFRAVRWPAHLAQFETTACEAAEQALAAFEALAAAPSHANPVLGAYRALGFATRALEALYPLASVLPPVGRFYLSDAQRGSDAARARIAAADPSRDGVGVMHAGNATTERGGFSVYVPEYYDGTAMPLVVALHGGSGHGRSFLWSWLRDARSRGVIVVAPTSRGDTWSLAGPDQDSDTLDAIVAQVAGLWQVDSARVLLTGMSDGGTFTYVSGLRDASPFTHLAPVSATFHPMLLDGASRERLQALPVYLVHGALDWMFPVEVARMARDVLEAARADVAYRELPDLSHTYPQDENDRMLDWLLAGGRAAPVGSPDAT